MRRSLRSISIAGAFALVASTIGMGVVAPALESQGMMNQMPEMREESMPMQQEQMPPEMMPPEMMPPQGMPPMGVPQ